MIPRIKNIEALDDLVLHILFDSGEEVLYNEEEDVDAISDFSPLKTDSYLFKNFTLV